MFRKTRHVEPLLLLFEALMLCLSTIVLFRRLVVLNLGLNVGSLIRRSYEVQWISISIFNQFCSLSSLFSTVLWVRLVYSSVILQTISEEKTFPLLCEL